MIVQHISKLARWYWIVLLFMGSFLLQYVLMSHFLPRFLAYSNGLQNPDQQLWYTHDMLEALYAQLGVDGRAFYANMLAVDVVYILITCLALSALLYVVLPLGKQQRFSLLPLLGGFFDLLENTCQWMLMKCYPHLPDVIVGASAFASFLKMLSMMCIVAILVFYSLRLLFLWFRKTLVR